MSSTARLRDDLDYLARAARAGARGDRTAAAPEPRRHGREDIARCARCRRPGDDARDASERLSERGGPHFGSPDKVPARGSRRCGWPASCGAVHDRDPDRHRRDARRSGSSRSSRSASSHERYGHVQEVIVQNFRAEAGDADGRRTRSRRSTSFCGRPRPRASCSGRDCTSRHRRTSATRVPALLDAGIDDWGGVSPVTVDHVNPEAPWPDVERTPAGDAKRGACSSRRGCRSIRGIVRRPGALGSIRRSSLRCCTGGRGRARTRGRLGCRLARDAVGAGVATSLSPLRAPDPYARVRNSTRVPAPSQALAKSRAEDELDETDVIALLRRAARTSRRSSAPPTTLRARGERRHRDLRRDPQHQLHERLLLPLRLLRVLQRQARRRSPRPALPRPLDEIVRRSREAWERGGVEVCLQGGIHPAFTGDFYLDVCRAIKGELPDIHVHAFSALEVWQGAATLGLTARRYLRRLREAGLASLPGTAAEILDDEVRAVICPDKVSTAQWLEVHDAAHRAGLRSTTTIMFGHADAPAQLGAPPVRIARPAETNRRLHRVRPPALRAHGGADLPQGPRASGPDLPRGDAHPRRRPARAPSAGSRTSRRLGSSSASTAPGRAPGGGQRPRRHADERVDLARGRSAHGQEMPPERMEERSAPSAARRGSGRRSMAIPTRAHSPLVRRRAARRAAQPERERRPPRSPRQLVRPGFAGASAS